MDVRFMTLSTPDLFIVLRAVVGAASDGKIPESVQVGPFDDRLLVDHGVWMRGPDPDVTAAVKYVEAELQKKHPDVQFVWSPEPLTIVQPKIESIAPDVRELLNEIQLQIPGG